MRLLEVAIKRATHVHCSLLVRSFIQLCRFFSFAHSLSFFLGIRLCEVSALADAMRSARTTHVIEFEWFVRDRCASMTRSATHVSTMYAVCSMLESGGHAISAEYLDGSSASLMTQINETFCIITLDLAA